MSHRIFGQVAGIATITGLALSLACGGGNKEEHSIAPRTPTVTGPTGKSGSDNGFTNHYYMIKASNVTGATEYRASAKFGEVTSITFGGNEWNYKAPETALTDEIKVAARNADGMWSNDATLYITVAQTPAPIYPSSITDGNKVNIKPGATVPISLPMSVAMSGFNPDTLLWITPVAKDNANAKDFTTKGSASIDLDGTLKIAAPSTLTTSDFGDYQLTVNALQWQDSYLVGNPSYTITVNLGPNVDGSDEPPSYPSIPKIDKSKLPHPTSHKITAGIPETIQFYAQDDEPLNFANQPKIWKLDNGTGVVGDKASASPANWGWIKTQYVSKDVFSEDEKPPANANASYETWRWTVAPTHPIDRTYSYGEGVFVAPNVAGPINFGVEVGFLDVDGNIATDYQTFQFDVKANTAPVVTTTTTKDSIVTIINDGGPLPWEGENNPITDKDFIVLVANEKSMPLSSTITFERTITDVDWPKDRVTLSLKGVWVDTDPKDTDHNMKDKLDIAPQDPSVDQPLGGTSAKWNNTIKFNNNPMVGMKYGGTNGETYTLTGGASGEGKLVFRYTVKDLANEFDYDFEVPFVANEPPVLDGNTLQDENWLWSDSIESTWIDRRPTEGVESTWKIEWSNTPARLKVSHRFDYDVYMETTNSQILIPFNAPVGQVTDGKPNNFMFKWTPIASQARQEYLFEIRAWDQYGAYAQPLQMKGTVSGNLKGEPISKVIYRNGETETTADRPVDLFRWANLEVDAFHEKKGLYRSELGEKLWFTPRHEDDSWEAADVPDRYLISGGYKGYLDGKDITAPVIGPATRRGNLILPATTWVDGKGGNLMAYAYISSTEPDLTTYVGSGNIAGMTDPSLGAQYYDFGLDTLTSLSGSPLTYMTKSDKDLTFETVSDAIQVAFPSIGQSAFFTLETTLPAKEENRYPIEDYWHLRQLFGSTPILGKLNPSAYPYYGDETGTFMVFDFAGALPYAMTTDDNIVLTRMAKEESFSKFKPENGLLDTEHVFSYWTMAATGIANSAEDEIDVTDLSGASRNIKMNVAGDSDKKFNANIDRRTFRDALNTLITFNSTESALDPNSETSNKYRNYLFGVDETLQVLAYVNGTELGAVENHHGVPVYLEFGNLNKKDHRPFGGELNLGSIDIPAPGAWHSNWKKTPVVSYVVKYSTDSTITEYSDGTGLTGTMGLITTDTTSGIALNLQPVTNLEITGKILPSATTVVELPVSNYYKDDILYRPGNITFGATHDETHKGKFGPTGTEITKTIQAHGIKVGDDSKVYLSWKNPRDPQNPEEMEKFSGNIIEFFKVPAGVNPLADATNPTPAFKVFVAPDVEKFPIPNTWVVSLGSGTGEAVARIRTVRYGEGDGMIDFNDTPFMQALPATWTETITTKIDFTNTGVQEMGWVHGDSYIEWSPAEATVAIPGFSLAGTDIFTNQSTGLLTNVTAKTVRAGNLPIGDLDDVSYGLWNAYTTAALTIPWGTGSSGTVTGTPHEPNTLNVAFISTPTLEHGDVMWLATNPVVDDGVDTQPTTTKTVVKVTFMDLNANTTLDIDGLETDITVAGSAIYASVPLGVSPTGFSLVSPWLEMAGRNPPDGYKFVAKVTKVTGWQNPPGPEYADEAEAIADITTNLRLVNSGNGRLMTNPEVKSGKPGSLNIGATIEITVHFEKDDASGLKSKPFVIKITVV
ncbi:MAG: hypothetical protein FWG02_03160 [Holophagaceae bacterium]|nr:hypothetical protein [Holophagaceae bacterium]